MMSILNIIGIGTALAANHDAAHPQNVGAGLLGMLPMLLIFIFVFYFLLIRPQSKRAKQHRQLIENLGVGDEVVTSGGMLGKVSKLQEKFIILQIAKDVEITIQKSAIASILPKGTMESAH